MKLLLAALLLAVPAVSGAQDYRASILYAAPADTAAPTLAYVPRDTLADLRQPAIGWPLFGGLAGGVAGTYGGLLVGVALDPNADDITTEMVAGLLVGEMLLLPVGVHLGNARKGSFLADLGVSVVIGTTAILLTSGTDSGVPLVVGAIAQYGAVVAVERSTAKKRLRDASILVRAD